MQVTIIPADKTVTIDGRGFADIDMSSVPAGVHAVQWNGMRGEIEYSPRYEAQASAADGESPEILVKPANALIDDLSAFQTVLDAWEARRAAEDSAQASIEALKAAKNFEINEARLTANNTTFPHLGKVFQCDVLSRGDIDGVANHIGLFGTFPPAFPGAWKTIDNDVIPMPSIEDFKAFYQSMTAQGTANFNKAQALKAQLAAAQTPEEIAAIKWEA